MVLVPKPVRRMNRPHVFAGASMFILVAGVAPAHAYLDPGNGSMLLQLLVGGLAGLLVMGKVLWHRALVWLRLRTPDSVADQSQDARPTDPPRD
jgi:hypothetical protein